MKSQYYYDVLDGDGKRRAIPLAIKRNVIETYRVAAGRISLARIAALYGVSRQSAHQWVHGRDLLNSGRQARKRRVMVRGDIILDNER